MSIYDKISNAQETTWLTDGNRRSRSKINYRISKNISQKSKGAA